MSMPGVNWFWTVNGQQITDPRHASLLAHKKAYYLGLAETQLINMKRVNAITQPDLTKFKFKQHYNNECTITTDVGPGYEKIFVDVIINLPGDNPPTPEEEIDGFMPYLFIGVRTTRGLTWVDSDGYTIHNAARVLLNVWEREEDYPNHEGEILSVRNANAKYAPLPNPQKVTLVLADGTSELIFYTENKLFLCGGAAYDTRSKLAVDPLPENDGLDHTWDQAVIWDDQDKSGVIDAIGKPTNVERYTACVSLQANDCIESRTECEYIVVLGRGKKQQVVEGTFYIEKGTLLAHLTLPLGYFDPTARGCKSAPYKDYGENPHDNNWWEGAIQIVMPEHSTELKPREVGVPDIRVLESYIPIWGFGGGARPARSLVCPHNWTETVIELQTGFHEIWASNVDPEVNVDILLHQPPYSSSTFDIKSAFSTLTFTMDGASIEVDMRSPVDKVMATVNYLSRDEADNPRTLQAIYDILNSACGYKWYNDYLPEFGGPILTHEGQGFTAYVKVSDKTGENVYTLSNEAEYHAYWNQEAGNRVRYLCGPGDSTDPT